MNKELREKIKNHAALIWTMGVVIVFILVFAVSYITMLLCGVSPVEGRIVGADIGSAAAVFAYTTLGIWGLINL